ncbi:MAG: LysR substrate-binding domain-containing protein [Pyramidobacter sp.]
MNLRDMKYILVIAEEKSITKAASKLYIAQPALSQCVQKVEKELAVPIFIRSTTGVKLTKGGEFFVSFAKRVLFEEKQLNKKIGDYKNSENGEVKIGFTGTQATYLLPYFLPKFQERYPLINVSFIEAKSQEVENMLVDAELEIGILHPPVSSVELETFELSTDELVIVPRRYSHFQQYIYYKNNEDDPYLDIHFLRNEPLLLPHPSLRSRMICDQIFKKAQITPHIRQVCSNINTAEALVQIDYGTAILPLKQLSFNLQQRGYYKIDTQFSVPYTFDVAVLKGSYISRAAQKLLNILHEVAGTF